MSTDLIRLHPAAEDFCAPRIGVGELIRQAFQGADLKRIWAGLMAAVDAGTAGPGAAMDLSIVAQLLGEPAAGLAIQTEVLQQHRLYWSRRAAGTPTLRLLAFAAALDLGGNTPIDFLIEGAGVDLYTVYVVPSLPLPNPLPLHDIAIVTVPESDETHEAHTEIERLVKIWPRPVVNLPCRIAGLGRDRLFNLIKTVQGIEIPATTKTDRATMSLVGDGLLAAEILRDITFPLIARPIGSHGGKGLEKLEDIAAIRPYLAARPEDEFFISRYVDYSSQDGQFRKYRIVFVDGRAYACHMGISDKWNIWYYNANMDTDGAKRAEEAQFMVNFDRDFGTRHRDALIGIAQIIGLEYFIIDCAETKSGRLLIFEADISSVVHNMDSPAMYPYKGPQMGKIFSAFTEMLSSRAKRANASDAQAALAMTPSSMG
jgi:hypothetical protein